MAQGYRLPLKIRELCDEVSNAYPDTGQLLDCFMPATLRLTGSGVNGDGRLTQAKTPASPEACSLFRKVPAPL